MLMVSVLLRKPRVAYHGRVMSRKRETQEAWRRRGRVLLMATAVVLASGPGPALAEPPRITVQNPLLLRFGSFAVPTSGYREVTATGGVSESGIFSLGTTGTGPARFVVQYDRGNNSKRRLDITIDLIFSTPPSFAQGGLTARLSRYQSDLPGFAMITPGQTIRITLPNCLQRVCSKSFNLGGRLDVDRRFGGGQVTVPIPVDAVLVSVI